MTRTLWDATAIGPLTMKNRFWKAAIYERWATPEGHITPEILDLYRQVTQGGTGTILTSYTRVWETDFPNPNMLAIYSDELGEEYRQLANVAHKESCSIVMQLVYGGARTGLPKDGRTIWGPSAIINESSGITPQAMTKDDIAALTRAFADAARRARDAGFDGVQIHAAHGYMLSSWLCPHFNRRTDEYGGSIENRTRLLVEILQAMKAFTSQNYPVFIKINSQDHMADGLTEEESIRAIQILEAHGLDGVEISGGNDCDPAVAAAGLGPSRKRIAKHLERQSYFAPYAHKLRQVTKLPIILTGGNRTYRLLEDIVQSGDADYVGLGRPLTSEPNLVNIWHDDPNHEPKCVACNKCFTTVGHRCILNPGTKKL